MQEDVNRGVKHRRGKPVVNAAKTDDFGTNGRLLVMAGGLIVLAVIASLFV